MNGNKTGNGFDKNPQNINRKGRPVSLKKRFKELHGDFDGTIWIDKAQTTERTTEDGKVQIGLKLNSMDSIILKLDKLISCGKDNVSLNAIKFLWEQLDGKAKQTVENNMDYSTDGATVIVTPRQPNILVGFEGE